jgi:hypothetical protein
VADLRSLRAAVDTSARRYDLVPILTNVVRGGAYLTVGQELSAYGRWLGEQEMRLVAVAAPESDEEIGLLVAEFAGLAELVNRLGSILRQRNRDAFFSGVGPRFPVSHQPFVPHTRHPDESGCLVCGTSLAAHAPSSIDGVITRAMQVADGLDSARADLEHAAFSNAGHR